MGTNLRPAPRFLHAAAILPKPAAPSIRQHIGHAVQRGRKISRKLRPDEQPASRSELVEDIGCKLPLSPTWT